MKHLFLLMLAAFLMLNTYSCKDDDDTFCINDVSFSGTIPNTTDNTITIPGGLTFEGNGAMSDEKYTIGKYEMSISSVNYHMSSTPMLIEYDVVYYFADGDGNDFWVFGSAEMTSNSEGIVWQLTDETTVGGGTGDFECATGNFTTTGTFDASVIPWETEFESTGSICGGCD